ncbi:MAG: cation:proton antiporter [Kiritimatiellia bacterium]
MKRKFFFSSLALFSMTLCAFASEGGAEPSLTHKMTLLVIQMGIILFAARVGGMLAVKFNLPGVLGELASGILIGPYALGGLKLGSAFPNGVFQTVAGGAFPVTPELYGFCTVASIVLLFLSGVETDMKMFVRYSFAGTMVGIGGVVVSFLFGSCAAVFLLPKILGTGPISFLSAEALFLGIMSTATSVGITARILSERKCIDSEEGVTTMAGAVIDDVLGIIVLAIGLGVIGAQSDGSSGVDWGHIGAIAAKAFGIWIGATVIGVLAARRISGLLKLFRSPLDIAILSFGLALILSGFFESMGLAMIIGAYVMGLALSRTDIRYVIQENLTPIYSFLVPIFFCVMGMMVDVGKLIQPAVLIFGTIYTVLAIVAKIVGCSIPALFFGFNGLGALRIGTGMIPRGEVALIVAGIGLSNGYLKSDEFGIGILMTLVTTLIAPPMLVKLYNGRSGLRHPKPAHETSRPFSFAMPSVQVAETMCSKLIDAFRAEGFFTHLLSHEDSIWQVRRDDVEIGLQRKGAELHFECSPREERFVATAVLAVTAELTHLANELAKPVTTTDLARHLGGIPGENGSEAKAPRIEADLARAIRNFTFIPSITVNSRDGIIQLLVDRLAERGLITDAKAAMEDLLAREAVMSTGLENGIAIPHARTDAVDSLIGAIAVVHSGIADYPTLDKSVVNIVVLTLSPREADSPHLRVISHIGKTLDADGRARLLASRTEGDMMDVLMVRRG